MHASCLKVGLKHSACKTDCPIGLQVTESGDSKAADAANTSKGPQPVKAGLEALATSSAQDSVPHSPDKGSSSMMVTVEQAVLKPAAGSLGEAAAAAIAAGPSAPQGIQPSKVSC